MCRRLKALLLTAVILLTTLAVMPVNAQAAASDYGMYVRNWERYYSKDGSMYFNFVLGAGDYDVKYSAKLLDSKGNTMASWSGFNILSGSRKQFKRFNLTKPNDKLTVNETYTLRVYGVCLADGREQSYYWDYKFKYRTDLHNYSASSYGMGVSYKFYEYSYGDITFNLWLSASKDKDVTYKVRLVNPDGVSIYFWNDVTIKAGTTDKKMTYSTTNAPIYNAGTYKIVVTQIVDYSGLHASYDKTFTYDYN